MPTMPSRWYRKIADADDISAFARHINQVCQFRAPEREFPAKIKFSGSAYRLARIHYEAEACARDLGAISGLYNIVKVLAGGNPLSAAAAKLGGIFYREYQNSKDKTLSDLRYIMSHYEFAHGKSDNGKSLTVHYGNSYDDSNHYSVDPKFY